MKRTTQLEREFFFSRDPANLITNSSFESDTSGWNLESSDFTRSDEEANSGSYSIKQLSSDGFGNLLTENDGIQVTPGQTYTASIYAMVTINSGNAPVFRISSGDKYGDDPSGISEVEGELTASAQFTKRSFVFTGPDSGVIWVRIFNNNGEVVAYYDDFKINPDRATYELNDVKRAYFQAQTGLETPYLEELEKEWLRKLIVDNGSTPVGIYTADLLKQALSALSLPVTNHLDQNFRTLYQNYTEE